MNRDRISVVLPAYESAVLVAEAVPKVRSDLMGRDVEIIVVDDGSSDDTTIVAREAGADQVIRLDENQGKGAAVREGLRSATGEYLVFTDVDLAYEPVQILNIVELLAGDADIAVGSRRHFASANTPTAGWIRDCGSWVFNRLTRLIVPNPFLDTQCALKGFTPEAARQIFGKAKIDGFAFDVELLFLARKMGLVVAETPVTLRHVEQSSVRFIPQAARMLWDLVRVRWWAIMGAYNLKAPRSG